MSNIYLTEPPPSGRVVLETSRGDIEVDLFADQCPLACKNFIALALEGYYDNMIWHRYVADFVLQSGDPSGTGVGGESFYGQDFADEPHQRLRFSKRGMLAMANGTDRNSNASQFFFTLAATPELQGKHTLFGKISNKTVYNLLALADSVGECDGDRPLYPPKLKTVRVLENPFEGQLQLRITREERAANKKNRRQAEKKRGPSGGVKNKVLLSFGEQEEDSEEAPLALKAGKSIHDALGSSKIRQVGQCSENGAGHREQSSSKVVEATQEPAAETPVEHESRASTSTRPSKGMEMLQAYRSKYAKGKSSTKKDEETARMLDTFRSRLKAPNSSQPRLDREEIPEDSREYGDDDDGDWRNHSFSSGQVLVQDQHREDEYVTLDPRLDKPDKGRRGRDWVDDRDDTRRRRKR